MVVSEPEPRTPLSRERVLRAAVRLADAGGIESVTMRRLADELGAEAMSLYHHVANKEDVLDGVIELITDEINETVGRIPPPATRAGWKKTMRERILAARRILLRHPWAPAVFQTRTAMGPSVLRYHDELVGQLRAGGFSYDLAHHSMHALGSRALGFTQELFDPSAGPGDVDPAQLTAMANQFPNLAGMLAEIVHDSPETTLGWCDDQTEFEFGLDVILDGLDRLRRLNGRAARP